jgi:ribonuclease HI
MNKITLTSESRGEAPEGLKGTQSLYPQLYFDGCSKGNPGRAGAGAVIYKHKNALNPSGELYTHSEFVGEKETNNVAEYTGLIIGLKDAIKLNIKSLDVFGDSQLVIRQMRGEYQVKSPTLLKLYQAAKTLEKQFDSITYNHVFRKDNKKADALANDA